MIEVIASGYLLRILSYLLMAGLLIGLGVVLFAVGVMILKSLWRLFND